MEGSTAAAAAAAAAVSLPAHVEGVAEGGEEGDKERETNVREAVAARTYLLRAIHPLYTGWTGSDWEHTVD